MLYMAVSFNDPLVQLGLFICAYIIVTGVCSYFGYSSDQYGIYMTFTAFMLSVIMILPDPINFGDTFNTIVPFAGVTTGVTTGVTLGPSVNTTVGRNSSAATVNGFGIASTNLAMGVAKVITDLMNSLPSILSFHTTVGRNSAAAAANSLSGFTDTTVNNEVELQPINKNNVKSLASNDSKSKVTILKVSPQAHALSMGSQNTQATSAKARPSAIELSNMINQKGNQ